LKLLKPEGFPVTSFCTLPPLEEDKLAVPEERFDAVLMAV